MVAQEVQQRNEYRRLAEIRRTEEIAEQESMSYAYGLSDEVNLDYSSALSELDRTMLRMLSGHIFGTFDRNAYFKDWEEKCRLADKATLSERDNDIRARVAELQNRLDDHRNYCSNQRIIQRFTMCHDWPSRTVSRARKWVAIPERQAAVAAAIYSLDERYSTSRIFFKSSFHKATSRPK